MRSLTLVSGCAACCLLWLPAAAGSGSQAPVPEDFQAPLSSVEVFTAWEAPLSSVARFSTSPQAQETSDLEETLDAQDEAEQTVVQLSDRFLFDFDSAQLRSTAASSLDTLVALLDDDDNDSQIEIIGHTDSLGGDEVNQPLSQERAEAVAGYLVDQGIDETRITTSGRGSSDPIAQNTRPDGGDDPEGRQQNRRVEVRYTDG